MCIGNHLPQAISVLHLNVGKVAKNLEHAPLVRVRLVAERAHVKSLDGCNDESGTVFDGLDLFA
jgi:hypothetical protein